jgi:DNA polymerase III gamma/tau subunit
MFSLKHRPDSFKKFIGNSSAINNLLSSFPDWPSTFLIVGPSGVGKTTLGRLIANQVKCLPINLKEIDAGQDRGIENIRQISKDAHNRPLMGKTKVYIIDECQGLTADAQQALLKITEEAPPNTYFIFCSTDPHKVIKPLKTRCQQGLISLLPLSNKELGIIIKNICEEEKIELKDKIKEIAILCIQNADGIPRNVVMLFEKYYRSETVEEVAKNLKNVETYIPEELWDMVNALEKDFVQFLLLFEKKKRGNYESFRITMGNIFKKKLLKAMIEKNNTKIDKYESVLQMFTIPVDNQLGDIELISRFSMYYNVEEEQR